MQTIVLYLCYIVLILLFSTAYNTSLIYCFVIWCLHTNKRRPCSSTLSGHPSSSFLLGRMLSGPGHVLWTRPYLLRTWGHEKCVGRACVFSAPCGDIFFWTCMYLWLDPGFLFQAPNYLFLTSVSVFWTRAAALWTLAP